VYESLLVTCAPTPLFQHLHHHNTIPASIPTPPLTSSPSSGLLTLLRFSPPPHPFPPTHSPTEPHFSINPPKLTMRRLRKRSQRDVMMTCCTIHSPRCCCCCCRCRPPPPATWPLQRLPAAMQALVEGGAAAKAGIAHAWCRLCGCGNACHHSFSLLANARLPRTPRLADHAPQKTNSSRESVGSHLLSNAPGARVALPSLCSQPPPSSPPSPPIIQPFLCSYSTPRITWQAPTELSLPLALLSHC
jgi:hypothetical protein